jgi:tetratricopeptide (TPR) repeat protein
MTLLHRLAAVVLTLGCLASGAMAAGDGYQEASALRKQGNDDAALSRLDAYLSEHPRDARARFLKGVILTERGRTDEAIDVLTALSEDFPELPEPHNNLAVLYAGQGKYDNARRELEMAIRAYPGFAMAHQNLGDVYAALAGQAYEKALQADPNSSAARTKLTRIRELLPESALAAQPPARAAPEPGATVTAPQTPASQPASPPTPTPPVAAETPAAAIPPPAVADPTRAVLSTVEDWAKAWSGKDFDKYLSFYARDFATPKGEPRGNWEAARRERLTTPRIIEVEVVEPKVGITDPSHATVTFKQNYRADTYRSSGRKTLQLVREGERWLIQRETITFR